MKGYSIIIGLLVLILIMSCETIIHPELENAEPLLVVDAWLTSKPQGQIIKLTYTQPYFEDTTPPGVTSATVVVTNETDGRVFNFNQDGSDGLYKWIPASATDSLGKPGDAFSLSIQTGGEEFISATSMGRAPAIDSITFTYKPASGFFTEYYLGEFWARDPAGFGDTYWIKAWRNDTLLLKPSEINIAYDAGFTEGGGVDGVTFIAPIRQAISPFETDDQGQLISPYEGGDSVYVEIHSISKAAFNFLYEVTIQTDRPGGFAELFASPFANVRTNIINADPNGKKAVGFFNVGTVSGLGKKFVN
jgi:hypothetical protein